MREVLDRPSDPDERLAELGRLVRIRRKELGLTIEEAVRSSGLSRTSWQGIEHARSESPRDATLRSVDGALSWRLGTSARLLAGEISEPESGDLRLYVETKSVPTSVSMVRSRLERTLDRLGTTEPTKHESRAGRGSPLERG